MCSCDVSYNFSSFISNFIDLFPLSFFFISMVRHINFVYFLKESDFSFTDLHYCFLHLRFIYFCSDLYDLFPFTNFGVLCFVAVVLISLVGLGAKG